jgi:hypothetical protein
MLLDLLPPELLLLLLNERRLVLSRELVVRLLLISDWGLVISASDRLSRSMCWVFGLYVLYVCIITLCQPKYQNTRISLALTLP